MSSNNFNADEARKLSDGSRETSNALLERALESIRDRALDDTLSNRQLKFPVDDMDWHVVEFLQEELEKRGFEVSYNRHCLWLEISW